MALCQQSVIDSEIDSLRCVVKNDELTGVFNPAHKNKLCLLLIKRGCPDEADSLNRLLIADYFHGKSNDISEFSRAIDIKGNICYWLSDMEAAYNSWNFSYNLRKTYLPERNDLLAESCCNIAKYFNFMIIIDSALIYSEKAVHLIENCSRQQWLSANVPDIFRTYIYAYKIGMRDKNMMFYSERTIGKLDSAMEIHHPLMYCYLPDLMHDKANVYTDLALDFRNEISNKNRNPILSGYYYHKAMKFYREEKLLRDRYNINPGQISTLYFTMALVKSYTYGKTVSNNLRCLAFADSSLAFIDESRAGGVLSKQFFRAGRLDVMKFKGSFLYSLFEATKDPDYLNEMYENAEEAYETFIFLANELKSKKFGSVFQVYNLFQFDALIYSEIELFKKTGDCNYLFKAFSHSQQSKFLDMLKEQAKVENRTFDSDAFDDIVRQNIRYTSSGNDAILDYYRSEYNHLIIFVVSDGKLRCESVADSSLSCLTQAVSNYFVNIPTDSVESALSELYKCLIKPVEKYIKGKHNIHITAKGNIASVPFDALIPHKSRPEHFLGDDYCIQQRFSLLIDPLFDNKIYQQKVSLFVLCPEYSRYTELLFNKNLCKDLSEKYESSEIGNIDQISDQKSCILHISAHGYFDSVMMAPELLINDSATVSRDDVAAFGCAPLLVSLVICESGKGVPKEYEGADNLARSFAVNGTPVVISSLWKTDDKAAALIMEYFYSFLDDGIPVHEALFRAKAQFRKEHPEMISPLYWGSLQSMGSNISIRIAHNRFNHTINCILAGGILLLLFGGVLFYHFFHSKKRLSDCPESSRE